MSHFTVLTAVALPGQLDAALGQMPDRQPINKIVSTLIQSCSGDTAEFDAQKHRPIDDQVRFECLVADLVDNQLAPYCEETNDPRYCGRKEYDPAMPQQPGRLCVYEASTRARCRPGLHKESSHADRPCHLLVATKKRMVIQHFQILYHHSHWCARRDLNPHVRNAH